VFGLSFGELVVLLLVAIVVLGPKEMPRYLRKAGQLAGQLRRMAYEMRAKSGIDEVLRSEGIGADIAEIRRLATFARGELGGIVSSVRSTAYSAGLQDVTSRPYSPGLPAVPPAPPPPGASPILGPSGQPAAGQPPPPAPLVMASSAPFVVGIDREREYPSGGPDTYGALPETSNVYDGQLPTSPLAVDPVYAHGAQNGAETPDAHDAHENDGSAEARP
jgi:sec-independent protein translocase protein TatB